MQIYGGTNKFEVSSFEALEKEGATKYLFMSPKWNTSN